MNQQILPTNTCFDDTAAYVQMRCLEDKRLLLTDALIIVHGIALGANGPRAGEPYAHAWVEEGPLCWDTGLFEGQRVFYAVAHDEYYAAHRIQATTRYTIVEAAVAELRAGHCAPWRPAYRALCANGNRGPLGVIEATYAPGNH